MGNAAAVSKPSACGGGGISAKSTVKCLTGGQQPRYIAPPPKLPKRAGRQVKADASDIHTLQDALEELQFLARDAHRGPKNRGIMMAAARAEILRARTILTDSKVTFDPYTPCELCKTKREELVEKQQGSAKSKENPGPLVKVMRMRLVRCNKCKDARKQFKGFSSKRDMQLVEMADAMAKECLTFTEADDDDIATKEKKLEDLEKKKKKAVTSRDYQAADAFHRDMEKILGRLDDPMQELVRIRKCTKLLKMIRSMLEEIKPKLAEAIRSNEFGEATLLKREKDKAESARHPLLHYVTRFTKNRQKIANARDRFANLVKPKPKEKEEE